MNTFYWMLEVTSEFIQMWDIEWILLICILAKGLIFKLVFLFCEFGFTESYKWKRETI